MIITYFVLFFSLVGCVPLGFVFGDIVYSRFMRRFEYAPVKYLIWCSVGYLFIGTVYAFAYFNSKIIEKTGLSNLYFEISTVLFLFGISLDLFFRYGGVRIVVITINKYGQREYFCNTGRIHDKDTFEKADRLLQAFVKGHISYLINFREVTRQTVLDSLPNSFKVTNFEMLKALESIIQNLKNDPVQNAEHLAHFEKCYQEIQEQMDRFSKS